MLPGYGDECVIELKNGLLLCTDTAEDNPAGSSYIRVCNKRGKELAYWISDEWRDEPEFVIGALMGLLNSGGE